jgi:hypothetical protein
METFGWNINMAERHWVNGGVNLNWSTVGNWSLTEGGAGGQTVPSANEDVFFDVGSPDCTIDSSIRVAKTLTTSAYTHTLTFNYSLRVSGSITIGANTKYAGDPTRYIAMYGASGTWTSNGNIIGQAIYVGGGTTCTCTLADALTSLGVFYLNNTTSTTFAGDFHITADTCEISGSQTITIVHDVTISGLTTISEANVINGLFNWNTGGLTTGGALTGTTTIVLTGGTWTGGSAVSNSVTFAGDVIVSGTIAYAASGTPTLTHSSGTITTTSSILSIASSCTLDTDPVSWNNVTLTAALTLTINSLLTATGTLTLPNATITFNGTAGFTVGTLTHTAITLASKTFTFEEAVTYTITTAMTCTHNTTQATYRYTYISADANIKTIITLGYGATQNVAFLDPTRIDSSLGQPIFSFTGAITNSYNWSNDLGHGRIIPEAGGESVTVAGITKDNSGVALGSCDVYLFRDNGTDTATYIAYQESNSVTGAYSFTVFPGSAYFVAAFKGGATPVMDVTYRDLAAV